MRMTIMLLTVLLMLFGAAVSNAGELHNFTAGLNTVTVWRELSSHDVCMQAMFAYGADNELGYKKICDEHTLAIVPNGTKVAWLKNVNFYLKGIAAIPMVKVLLFRLNEEGYVSALEYKDN